MEMGKQIIVLGMHRSATSLVAKGLHEAGVDMGKKLMGPGPGNEQGHFEDLEFVNINDLLLGDAGGDWDKPPKDISDTKFEREINQALSNKKGLWGFKDPRTTLTIKRYYDKLEDPILVACFRKPEKVAKSLRARGLDKSEEYCIELAKEYNRRLLKFLTDRFT